MIRKMFRRRKIGLYGGVVPGLVKLVDVKQFVQLRDEAARLGFSARGRQGLADEVLDSVEVVTLRPIGVDGTPDSKQSCWRCNALIFAGKAGLFTCSVDVEMKRFESLSEISDVYDLAEMVANSVPFLGGAISAEVVLEHNPNPEDADS